MIRVGVIRGGTDPHYEASLLSGGHILSHLRSDEMNKEYSPLDIFISKDGTWHIQGIPTTLDNLKEKVDIVFNALHGEYGQNDNIQEKLEQYGILYTGSGSSAYRISNNNALAKEEFAKLGINTPRHILFSAYLEDLDGPIEEYVYNKAHEVLKLLPPPWIVKPLTKNSSMGIHVCKTFQELVRAFIVGVKQKVSILVEEMIEGRDTTISVIDNFRGQNTYSLLCTDNFSSNEKREVESLASRIHDGLKLKHYSQTHFIISPKKGIYVIEVNTTPELKEDSLFHEHLKSIGSSMPEFINHIINLAIK